MPLGQQKPVISKDQLQGKLDLPRGGSGAGDFPRIAETSPKAIEQIKGWNRKVRTIEQVVELRPELEFGVLVQDGNPCTLHNAKVKIRNPRGNQDIASRIPLEKRSGITELRDVEVLVWVLSTDGSLVAPLVGLPRQCGPTWRAFSERRLLELLAAQPEVGTPSHPLPLPPRPRGAIAIEGVDFHYPSRPDMPALDNFSLAVAPAACVPLTDHG